MECKEEYLNYINEQMTNFAQFDFEKINRLEKPEDFDKTFPDLAEKMKLLGTQLKNKIDEFQKLNEELLRQKNFMSTVMELIPSYVFVVDDHSGEITFSNKCASNGQEHPCLMQVIEQDKICDVCEFGARKKVVHCQHFTDKAGVSVIKVESEDHKFNWYKLSKQSMIKDGENSSSTIYSLVDITDLKVNELNLIKKEEVISSSLREKALLLQEVHHRVKNNLQIIYGLLSMQVKAANSEEVKVHLVEIQNRIYSISLIHEELYQSENFLTIDVSNYCKKLCNTIGALSNANQEVRFYFNLQPDVKINIERATPLGLYINEVICNAFKHAFKGNKAGTIQVELSEDAEAMKLVISDNGPGLHKGDDQFFSSTSLGSRLIKGLSQQLKGNLEVDGSAGCTVRLTIPKLKKVKNKEVLAKM